MNLTKRKCNRLPDFDYSSNGYYFITICTAEKQKLLCNIVGEGLCALPICENPETILTNIGKAVDKSINYINENYCDTKVDKYIIMPNHIHLIIKKSGGHRDPPHTTGGHRDPHHTTGGHRDPPLQSVIGRMKSYTTKIYGKELWQRSFYDHIIRDENDYLRICEYIENNPQKWSEDKYYVK